MDKAMVAIRVFRAAWVTPKVLTSALPSSIPVPNLHLFQIGRGREGFLSLTHVYHIIVWVSSESPSSEKRVTLPSFQRGTLDYRSWVLFRANIPGAIVVPAKVQDPGWCAFLALCKE